MELSGSNFDYCMKLAQRFAYMKRLPSEDRFDGAMEFLAETLVKACKSRETAAEVANLVVEREEDFPAPATLRKYLREMNYVEEDVEKRRDEANRREIAAMKEKSR